MTAINNNTVVVEQTHPPPPKLPLVIPDKGLTEGRGESLHFSVKDMS